MPAVVNLRGNQTISKANTHVGWSSQTPRVGLPTVGPSSCAWRFCNHHSFWDFITLQTPHTQVHIGFSLVGLLAVSSQMKPGTHRSRNSGGTVPLSPGFERSTSAQASSEARASGRHQVFMTPGKAGSEESWHHPPFQASDVTGWDKTLTLAGGCFPRAPPVNTPPASTSGQRGALAPRATADTRSLTCKTERGALPCKTLNQPPHLHIPGQLRNAPQIKGCRDRVF